MTQNEKVGTTTTVVRENQLGFELLDGRQGMLPGVINTGKKPVPPPLIRSFIPQSDYEESEFGTGE